MSKRTVHRLLSLLFVVALLIPGAKPGHATRPQPADILPDHSATSLLDGRVLVVDGAGVRFYLPGGLQTQSGPPLITARSRHSATLLLTGEALVAGGLAADATALATVKRFDPVTDQWRPAAAMNSARAGHTATLLANGDLLVIGGEDGAGVALSTVERYRVALDRWELLPPLAAARRGHTATLLGDGRVAVIGGRNADDPLATIELYDPATQKLELMRCELETMRKRLDDLLAQHSDRLARTGMKYNDLDDLSRRAEAAMTSSVPDLIAPDLIAPRKAR